MTLDEKSVFDLFSLKITELTEYQSFIISILKMYLKYLFGILYLRYRNLIAILNLFVILWGNLYFESHYTKNCNLQILSGFLSTSSKTIPSAPGSKSDFGTRAFEQYSWPTGPPPGWQIYICTNWFVYGGNSLRWHVLSLFIGETKVIYMGNRLTLTFF